jgi:transcription elongation GreA/GreB family factor
MRKMILTLAALAAFGIALPVATTQSANAETMGAQQNRGYHYGWRNHRADRAVIVTQRRHRDSVIVREGRRNHGVTMGATVR